MRLSDSERSVLHAAIDRGVREGGRRLAKLTQRDWDVQTTSFNDGPMAHMKALTADGHVPHRGMLLPLQGGGRLAVVALFPLESGRMLAQAFASGHEKSLGRLPNLETQALGEISNIIAHAASGAIADDFKTAIILASPRPSEGPKLELLDAAVAALPGGKLTVLLSGIKLVSVAGIAKCSLVFLVDEDLLLGWLKARPGGAAAGG